jgi:hypothetical protein
MRFTQRRGGRAQQGHPTTAIQRTTSARAHAPVKHRFMLTSWEKRVERRHSDRLQNDRIDGEQLSSTAYQGGTEAW